MKLIYEWDTSVVDIREDQVTNDIEFSIKILAAPLYETMSKSYSRNRFIQGILLLSTCKRIWNKILYPNKPALSSRANNLIHTTQIIDSSLSLNKDRI